MKTLNKHDLLIKKELVDLLIVKLDAGEKQFHISDDTSLSICPKCLGIFINMKYCDCTREDKLL